jgi:FAD-linked sulfhydryl oxidase
MIRGNDTSPEDLGRCTWMFLHTLAAQYPENPTAGQERDAKDLIGILTRMYPCDTCAHHFADVVSRHPPDVSTGFAFQRWLCAAHNEVNLRLEKEQFDCTDVHIRWRGLQCSETQSGCSALVGRGVDTNRSVRLGI